MSPNIWLFCAVCQTRILMEPIHRMNQKQLGDFKRRRANLALLMKNNEETSKEEEQTWLCWCLNKDILFLMCCSLLAASIYGLSRECRENLNIRCMRKWFWIKQAARKPRNSCSPDSTMTIFNGGGNKISYHVPFLMCNLVPTPALKGFWKNCAKGEKHFQNILLLIVQDLTQR